PGLVQAVLDLVPEVRAAQRPLHELIGRGAGDAAVVELHARQHVVADGHGGERVRLLEHHADPAADVDRIDLRVVDVLAVDLDAAGRIRPGDHLVHAVQGAQEGGLPAAGGPDQRGHRAGADLDVDALHGEEVAVVDVKVLDVDGLGSGHRKS